MKPIHLSEVNDLTLLPKDMKTFWASNSNKDLLEKLIYRSSLNLRSSHQIVVQKVNQNDDEWRCVSSDNGASFLPYKANQPYLEEADLKIILYVFDSVKSGFPRVTVFSNEIDVLITLLYHMPVLLLNGLEELLIKGGLGDTTRYIPLHTMYTKVGVEVCSVLPALQSLTGCDITSKVGSKKAAMAANPARYLRWFGRHDVLTEYDVSQAVQFLCEVITNGHEFKNFQELRTYLYNFSVDKIHWNIPPTSTTIMPHIQRAFLNTYNLTHLIEDDYAPINPELNGFGVDDSLLLPVSSKRT